jgi:hypothetical protein
VLNAFLNAKLEQRVYIQTLEVFIKEIGKLLKLKKALYSLKDALLLYYKHLKNTLTGLGLRPIKDVLCLFISN